MATGIRPSAESHADPYLRDIQDAPLLNAEQERDLAARMQKKDSADPAERRDAAEARDRFVRSNLRLVVSIARRFVNRGLPLQDLVEEGNLGLLHAVGRFDPRRKCRFSTYATWWIRQAIRRALVNTAGTIRVPSYMAEAIVKWKTARNGHAQKTGRRAGADEVLQEMGLEGRASDAMARAVRAARIVSRPVSLDSFVEGPDVEDAGSVPPPEESLSARLEVERVRELLRGMDPREASILHLRFGFGGGPEATLGEVGRRLHVTRERVRQIEKNALRKLRERFSKDGMRPSA
jgi:RNA polymerase primary sigma factor